MFTEEMSTIPDEELIEELVDVDDKMLPTPWGTMIPIRTCKVYQVIARKVKRGEPRVINQEYLMMGRPDDKP